MSARVLNPVVIMSEMRRVLHPAPLDPERSRIRRNLFGPVNHDENRKFVTEELSRIRQLDKNRWNFDFDTETPTEGRYKWEQVGVPGASQPPSAYELKRLPFISQNTANRTFAISTPIPQTVVDTSSSSSSHVEVNSSSSCASTVCRPTARKCNQSSASESVTACSNTDSARLGVVAELPPTTPAPGIAAKQTRITDFLRTRKRPSATKPSHSTDTPTPPPTNKKARTGS